jgi:hypothetical protein
LRAIRSKRLLQASQLLKRIIIQWILEPMRAVEISAEEFIARESALAVSADEFVHRRQQARIRRTHGQGNLVVSMNRQIRARR